MAAGGGVACRAGHRRIAAADGAARYEADVAPFVGVAAAYDRATAAVETLVAPGELAIFVGTAPPLSDAWRVEHDGPIAQMIRRTRLDVPDGPATIELTREKHVADMLALPGFLACDRYRQLDMEGRPTGVFVALYEVETDDPAALLQSVFAAVPTMRLTDAIDPDSAAFTFLQ